MLDFPHAVVLGQSRPSIRAEAPRTVTMQAVSFPNRPSFRSCSRRAGGTVFGVRYVSETTYTKVSTLIYCACSCNVASDLLMPSKSYPLTAMRQSKRKWSKVPSAERRLCEAPGCAVFARQRCKQLNCNHQFCEEHKGAHSQTHSLQKKKASR